MDERSEPRRRWWLIAAAIALFLLLLWFAVRLWRARADPAIPAEHALVDAAIVARTLRS